MDARLQRHACATSRQPALRDACAQLIPSRVDGVETQRRVADLAVRGSERRVYVQLENVVICFGLTRFQGPGDIGGTRPERRETAVLIRAAKCALYVAELAQRASFRGAAGG